MLTTTHPPPWASPSYRPDIDGLRAISVIAVILFHAFPDNISGGFIGVDVFFVISGFLIGGLISYELDAHSFSFRDFYARRVRRIFPALVAVVAFVLLIGWNSMFPSEFRQLGRHVAAAALFVSNFALLDEVGYFDMEAHTKPLLHLWSLAIEEQFYLVWPLFAWTLRNRRALFLWATAAIALASFLLNVTMIDASVSFYSPLTRTWELAIGVLAAHVPRGMVERLIAASMARFAVGAAGLTSIVVAAFVTEASSFPGWWPLIPVFGAALVILGGPRSFTNSWILASKPMIWIGKISYPLYLWHWPLFAYAWLAYGTKPPVEVRFVLLAASLLCAWVTYTFVEKPIRFGAACVRAVPSLSTVMLVLGATGFAILHLKGLPDRSVAEINRSLANELSVPTASRVSDGTCTKKYGIDTGDSYVCFVNSPAPRILVVGDSVSMAFYSAIHAGLFKENASLVATHSHNWAKPGCLPSGDLGPWMLGTEACKRVIRTVFDILGREPSIDTVVIPAYAYNPVFTNETFLREFQQKLLKLGKKVVYVMSVPMFGNPPGGCHPRQLFLLGFDITRPANINSLQQLRSQLAPPLLPQRELFQKMGTAPGTFLFDAFEPFCDAEVCYQSYEGGPFYWSWGHINERGSSHVLRQFLPWLHSNVLTPPNSD